MNLKLRFVVFVLSLALLVALHPAPTRANDDLGEGRIKRVLLISIDGMHAVDYANCVASNTCPHLAALGRTGVNYTRTTTSRPSDSFPGLMSLVSGGRPRTVGALYGGPFGRRPGPPEGRPRHLPPG